jgi:hypothetical protein
MRNGLRGPRKRNLSKFNNVTLSLMDSLDNGYW